MNYLYLLKKSSLILIFSLTLTAQIMAQVMIGTSLNLPDFESVFSGDKFVIKGKVTNAEFDFLEVFVSTWAGGQDLLAIPLGEDGSFEEVFPIIGGQQLVFNRGMTYIFHVMPNDTLEIYVSRDEPDKIRVVQKNVQLFRDMEALKNQYQELHYSDLQGKFRTQEERIDKRALAEEYFNELVQHIYGHQQVFTADQDHLDDLVLQKYGSEDEFRVHNLIDHLYWELSMLLDYNKVQGKIHYQQETMEVMDIKQREVLIAERKLRIPASLAPGSFVFQSASNTREAPQINDLFYLNIPGYREYLNYKSSSTFDLVNTKLSFRAGIPAQHTRYLYHIIGLYGTSAFVCENMMYRQIMRTGSKIRDAEDAQTALDFAKSYIQSPYLRGKLAEFESFRSTLAEGAPAPDFTFEDENGNPVRLSDFRGKVVYLDFWGVYCGPCITENTQYAPGIYQHYQDKNVVFINVCVDVDREKWKNSIKTDEKRDNVVQLYADGKVRNEHVRAYNVQGIPHYYLIDKEGKIHRPNAARPSSLSRDLHRNELSLLLDK